MSAVFLQRRMRRRSQSLDVKFEGVKKSLRNDQEIDVGHDLFPDVIYLYKISLVLFQRTSKLYESVSRENFRRSFTVGYHFVDPDCNTADLQRDTHYFVWWDHRRSGGDWLESSGEKSPRARRRSCHSCRDVLPPDKEEEIRSFCTKVGRLKWCSTFTLSKLDGSTC